MEEQPAQSSHSESAAAWLPNRRALLLLAAAIFFVSLGFGFFESTFNNFAVNELNLTPRALGVLEAMRETPGFLNAFVSAATLHLAEPVVAGICLALMGLGFISLSRVRTTVGLIFWSVAWSLGFHTWGPVSSTIALGATTPGQEGKTLGWLNSVGSLAGLAGVGGVFLLSEHLHLRIFFVIGGLAVLVAAACASRVPPLQVTEARPRLVFRRRYWLYYLLCFLDGWRRQMWYTFALFLLVREYHTSLRIVASLVFMGRLGSILAAPQIGKAIDRLGPRTVMSTGYVIIAAVFAGYCFVRVPLILRACYAFDYVLSNLGVGLTTYANQLAPQQDLRATLAMGTTANHVAAVIGPVLGGLVWQRFGYQTAFLSGLVTVLVFVALSLLLPRTSGRLPLGFPPAQMAGEQTGTE
jgi:hypothetical protein